MNVARIFVERLADQLRQESLPAADPAQVRRLGRRGTGRLFAVVPVQLSDQFFRFDRFDLHCKARQHLDLLFCRLVIPLPLAGTHHGVSLPVIRHEQVTPSLGGGEQLDDFGRDAFGKIHLIRRYSVQTIKARLKNVTSGIGCRIPHGYPNPNPVCQSAHASPQQQQQILRQRSERCQQQCEYQIAGTDILPEEVSWPSAA